MFGKKIAKADVDYVNKEVSLLDENGNPIEENKSVKDRVLSAGKTLIKYSPLGMTYTVSKGMMEMMNSSINENEMNAVENISFEQVVDLIKEGKNDFDELNLTFTAAQANGINIGQLKKEVSDQDVTIGFGKKGGIGLEVHVKYKSNSESK